MRNYIYVMVALSFLVTTVYSQPAISYEKYYESVSELKRLASLRSEALVSAGIVESLRIHIANIRQFFQHMQNELQSITLLVNSSLHDSTTYHATHAKISGRLSNLTPATEYIAHDSLKEKKPKNNTSLTKCIKVLEKYEKLLTTNKGITQAQALLDLILQEIEPVEKEIKELAHIAHTLSISYSTHAKNIFSIAIRLYKLTGIDAHTGPYVSDELQEE